MGRGNTLNIKTREMTAISLSTVPGGNFGFWVLDFGFWIEDWRL
jgi:hypothetical protein